MPVPAITHEEIIERMGYHAGTPAVAPKYALNRDHAIALAFDIVDACPPSRETSLAITALEEALMWANKAIARTTPVDTETPHIARVLPEQL